jgi:carboxyl-terminal processing protease
MKKALIKKPAFKFVAGIIVGICITLSLALLILPIMSGDNIYSQIEKYQFIMSMATKDYFEEVDISKLNEGGIRGMLKELDPHSNYYTAKEMKKINEDMTGSFDGVGVQFNIINDTIIVEGVIPDGPSERVGIKVRDRIIGADGNSLIGISWDSVPRVLRGPKGTTINLTIYRPVDREVYEFKVTRDKLPSNSVRAAFVMQGTDIGYIKLDQYTATTYKELVDTSKKLKELGMKKLIFDLRSNGGGILDQAYKVCDEFIASDTIVYTKARRESDNRAFVARPGQSLENIPLIVLIDGGSASASEITAGTVQDLDRGLVVGITSFGKGLVQTQIPLNDGSALRLTTARFFTASGRCLQRPYKDIESWKRLTDRLELEEGSNLEHTLDKIKKEEAQKEVVDKKKNKLKNNKDDKSINMDSIEIYYTRSGRPVLGGGGVTPDYIVKYDTTKLTTLAAKLRNQDVFGEFREKFLIEVQKKYNNDFAKFNNDFEITKDMVKELKKLAKEKDIEWNDEQYDTDKNFIMNQTKYMLARGIWNFNSAYQILISQDRQMKKAMELFPLAEKIYNSKKK